MLEAGQQWSQGGKEGVNPGMLGYGRDSWEKVSASCLLSLSLHSPSAHGALLVHLDQGWGDNGE